MTKKSRGAASTKNRRTTGGNNRAPNGRFVSGNTAGAATKFQPGQSGNPDGRPKSLAANIRERIGEDGNVIVAELLAIAQDRRGTAWGRVQACRELLNRAFGQSPQEVSMTVTPVPTIAHRPTIDQLKRVCTIEEVRVMRDVYRRLAEDDPSVARVPLTEQREDGRDEETN